MLRKIEKRRMQMADGQKDVKRLYRSRTSRVIAGVAGGIGNYLGVDPVVIRVIWVILLIPGFFPALIAYLICWAIIPQEP
jgi:phage shock protein PspC (stress-responsive transcriptional regulator)